jgi:wyosine [tRNA(Phe)-imidazoG37] synthetase (radical SAM superfamily)/SAM-dependent methyltransferase
MSPGDFRYVYGPVPSRRLGRSLGVDLVPLKTCTYDCVYCQLGRTTNKTVERKEYVAIEDVLAELKRKLAEGDAPDYISLAGSGEPTLNAGIGELIDGIKHMTNIPAAVLTNGSLLWMGEVRDALMAADLVLPSLDAGDENLFRYINRPHADISFETMVDGLAAFTASFRREVWLEVFLLAGVTGVPSEVEKIAALARRIGPARVQLNTVSRPPAEEFAFSLASERMHAAKRLFAGDVDIISETYREGPRGPAMYEADEEEILALIRRRPCTAEDVAGGLGIHVTEALKRLEKLVAAGKAVAHLMTGRHFYSATGLEKDIRMRASGDFERYAQSCRQEFWKGIFRREIEYLLRHLKGSTDVLSVGCGPAIMENELSGRGFRVTGLDVSREALALAPERVGRVAARAEDMPFPASSFDAVVYVASLQFIEDYAKALENTARVLRPNGTLVVMLLNPESSFFKEKLGVAHSYVHGLRHTGIADIERAIAARFDIRTEYFLGVKGDRIFESRDATEAAVYAIMGTKLPVKRGTEA